MAMQTSTLAIKWSVWDSNPLVSWSWEGGTSTVVMKMPPISVTHLAAHHVVAVNRQCIGAEAGMDGSNRALANVWKIKMTIDDSVEIELQKIVESPDFSFDSEAIVESWISKGKGFEAVNHVLMFMERNPGLDYGTPGALVHFLERFYLHGYEDELLASIGRRPTPHTAWMLNRLIGNSTSPDVRLRYVNVLKDAKHAHQLDDVTLDTIDHFLSRL